MSDVTTYPPIGGANAAGDFSAALAALDGQTGITFAADVRMDPAELGKAASVVWDPSGFYVSVSGDTIRAGVKTSDGTIARFFAEDDIFSDLQTHRVELTIDSATNVFRVVIGGRTLFEQADLDLVLPATFTDTQFGQLPWSGNTTAAIANLSAEAATIARPILPSLKDNGTLLLTFDTLEPPVGLILQGDATVGTDGALSLDGDGDFAVLSEQYNLANANYLSVDLDFRYADTADTGGSRLIWNHGAFGVQVDDKSVTLMVTDDQGKKNYFRQDGVDLSDLDWHHLSLVIDPQGGAATLRIDDVTLIEKVGIGLSLPATARPTTIGSDSWGNSLNGQIDNVALSTQRPLESWLGGIGAEPSDIENWDAVGLANPAVAMNTTGYIKWAESTAATFIDRMKGAFAWTGKQEILFQDRDSYHIFRDAAIFTDPALVKDVTFSSETLLNIHHLITDSRWNKNLIDKTQQEEILANYRDYFKIETGASGNSELWGRLHDTDAFSLLARFDSDIGMDLDDLRTGGQAWLAPADFNLSFTDLDMDRNGWLKSLPTNAAGGVGTASTVVMWYPEEAAQQPGNIYGGTFYLLADGKGTIDLQQAGQSTTKIDLKGLEIDGPTMIPFEYAPDGERVTLTITSSDPNGTGEYVRNVHIVHEDHLEMFQAGEIFTPEFVELHQDARAVRWMAAQDGNHIVPNTAGAFEDAHTKDYYSFNLGTNGTPANGVPVDAIIEFANKTGSDPWVNVNINASDVYVRGMAEYIEANLDPRLTLHLEFGNENWNGVFDTYQVSKAEGLERWGELRLETDNQGGFVRDANGDLIVLEDGYFFSTATASNNGFQYLDDLAVELGLAHNLYSDNQAWAEWSSMRATEVAVIFDDVFTAADPHNADGRLNKVMGAFSSWDKSTDFLMQANVWHEAEPGGWIDPAGVFDSLAVAGYIGGTAGNKHSDMVRYWIDNYGEQKAAELLIRQLKSDVDPSLQLIEFERNDFAGDNTVKASAVHSGITYSPDLVVDVYNAIFGKDKALRDDIQSAAGMTGAEVLVGADVHNYVRLDTAANGNTVLQLRVDPANGDYETVVEFDSPLSLTIEQMLEEGTLFVRSVPSIGESANLLFGAQKAKADAYGLDLVAYEGGQHLAAATWGAYRANLADPTLTDFLMDLNDSPEMGELYGYWFDAWQNAGGALFAHYADYGLSSRYGSWGALEYLGEQNDPNAATYRYDALQEWNQQDAWWDDGRDPTAFLHGVIDTGTAGDELLRGTSEEDILLGGDGDDEIYAGPGNDRIGGGTGANIVDAGDGDDIILLESVADQIDGGAGWDTLRLASGLSDLDLADLNAVNVEALDLRNFSQSNVTISVEDAFAFTGDNLLTVHAETADIIELTGFTHQGTVIDENQVTNVYASDNAAIDITVEVIHAIEPPPDAIILY